MSTGIVRFALTGLYVAVCAGFAASAQLFMELRGGVAERDNGFDMRHLVLGLAVVIVALAAAVAWHRFCTHARGSRDAKRLLRLGLHVLPGGRNLFALAVFTAGTTLTASGAAHVGERGAAATQDALGWVVLALVVAIVAAVIARFVVRTLPDIVAAFVAFVRADTSADLTVSLRRDEPPRKPLRGRWPPRLLSRPPPLQA